MLNRRILRIKAFKLLYSYAENTDLSLKEAQSQLELSCEATRDLYLFLLGVICPLTGVAKSRLEAGMEKFNPSEEERNPNFKFVGNSIAPLLGEDPDFQKLLKKKKLSWDQYDVLLRHLYDSIKSRDYFTAYMSNPERSLEEDAALWCQIFENELQDNAELESILEDLSIWWNDDVDYALSWCCRSLEELGKGARWNLPALYMSDIQNLADSDKAFVNGIVKKGVLNFDSYCAAVAELTPRWDRSRICTPDLALIISGMAEHDAFPALSSKVIINEYVEISKFYSTPESRSFVNGLLDNLINKNSES